MHVPALAMVLILDSFSWFLRISYFFSHNACGSVKLYSHYDCSTSSEHLYFDREKRKYGIHIRYLLLHLKNCSGSDLNNNHL